MGLNNIPHYKCFDYKSSQHFYFFSPWLWTLGFLAFTSLKNLSDLIDLISSLLTNPSKKLWANSYLTDKILGALPWNSISWILNFLPQCSKTMLIFQCFIFAQKAIRSKKWFITLQINLNAERYDSKFTGEIISVFTGKLFWKANDFNFPYSLFANFLVNF